MEIDFGALEYNDPQTYNITIKHAKSGKIIKVDGAPSIYNYL